MAPAAERGREWSRVDDLIAVVRRRWSTGRYLADYAGGMPFTPVVLSVAAPRADEVLVRLAEATTWLARFERESSTAGGHERFTIEYRIIQGRAVGANRVPARIRIETFGQLCALLETAADVAALDEIIRVTADRLPLVLPWVVRHPLDTIANRTIWPDVLSTVLWIEANETSQLYLRHIDVDRVDTKFVEANRNLISDLLTLVLPPEHIDTSFARSDLVGRFGFRRKPTYVRIRLLAADPRFPTALTELTLRTEEFADLEPSASIVFIVENEVSYLAFPIVPNAIVVFGAGFAIDIVKGLGWLNHKTIVYWGDIDTHGLTMLSRLRARFSHVQSILMDHQTLAAHPAQWVIEPSPTSQPLTHLTEPEADLYRDLIEDRYGTRVRLEQERVRFSHVRRAIEPWLP